MKPRTLITISLDPRKSARPAEGIRIAAGVGAWKKTDITLLFRGAGGYSLAEEADDFIDQDNFTRYLPIVVESGIPIYLTDDFEDMEILKDSPWKYEVVSEDQIAELYSRHHYFIQM